MDRYDELLRKAREEMVVPEETHESVFDLVWQGVEKGLFDGMRRGYGKTRRPIGAPVRNLSSPEQQQQYRQIMDYTPPQPIRRPRAPRAPEPAMPEEVDPGDGGRAAMRHGGPPGPPPQGPGDGGPPQLPPTETKDYRHFPHRGPPGPPSEVFRDDGTSYADSVVNTEGTPPSLDGGHDKGTQAGMNALMRVQDTPPSMRQASPEESAQLAESDQEMGIVPYGYNFDEKIPRGTQLPPGKDPKQLPAPKTTDPVEAGFEEMKTPVEEEWSPKLGESGTWGGHEDHYNPKTQKLYGKRSKPYGRYKEWSNKQTGKAKEGNKKVDPGVEEKPKKKGINMPQLVENETTTKPTVQGKLFPETETPTDDESNKKRQEKRAKDREEGKRPGLLEGLVAGGKEGGGEDWPTVISQTGTPRDVVDAMYEAAKMGDAKALSSLRNNQADAEVVLGMDPDDLNDLFSKGQWQNADLSLLPSGLLKHIRNEPQQADADYSLLPRGWQEGVVQ